MNSSTASREELLDIIVQQQALIDQLRERVRELETGLGKGGPKGMPGLKPGPARGQKPKSPRKRRPHGFARRRASEPTERVFHAVECCPRCDIRLMGGSAKRRREVIEIPIESVRVIEHVFIERRCPRCRKRLVPKDVLGGVVVGKQRLGVNLMSLMVTLREEARVAIGTIRWYLETFHRLRLSEGAIVSAIQRAARLGEGKSEEVREKIQASPVVLADETGWREDGANGYVWTFSTDKERYFVRRGRNKEVVDEVLGAFSGVLVSDFYASYNHYPGLHQRCWAHLLRDIHELKEVHPDDEGLRAWAEAVGEVYKEAKGFRSPKERKRVQAKAHFEDKLLRLCQPFMEDDGAAQRRLCLRIIRFLSELFVFVGNPEVPADNNGAERSLRHLVTSRKISGGTRSPAGTSAKMTLASLFGTWRAQELNPFLQCRQLLTSPQV